MNKALILGCLVIAVSTATIVMLPAQEQQSAKQQPAKPNPDQAAVERARDTVRLLDNVYKQTIVLVTEKYVHDEDDFPAGSAAVELFKRIGKSGTHEVRLIDATGDPYEPANVARNEFEKAGLKVLKSGKDFHNEVVIEDGVAYLQAVTPVPVVMKKCVMCHSHYADVPEGQPIGAISYKVPIK